ncbi:hypothetical protein ACI6QG_16015 [Roseococcus sp. DSY-14]|uniref:hypothetical protein n=1 Tax=Roseococcus sp. DSY-14 TaxID=3369650 RepID=UPI00387AF1D3
MPRRNLAFLLMLAACGPEGGEAALARAALDSQRATLQALGAPAPALRPAPRPVAAARASQFMGATPDALRAALGEPLLRREEGAAAVWLYSAGGCQLDVIFYDGAQGRRVGHVQARAGGVAQRTEAACLRDIQSAARRPPGTPPPAELGA